MNAKMDSRPLSYQIINDASYATAKFTILKVYYTVLRRMLTLTQNYQLHKCSKNIFTQNPYHIKTSPLICTVNQLAGFFMVQIFNEGYFEKDWYFKSDNWQTIFCLYVVLIIMSLSIYCNKLKQIIYKIATINSFMTDVVII